MNDILMHLIREIDQTKTFVLSHLPAECSPGAGHNPRIYPRILDKSFGP